MKNWLSKLLNHRSKNMPCAYNSNYQIPNGSFDAASISKPFFFFFWKNDCFFAMHGTFHLVINKEFSLIQSLLSLQQCTSHLSSAN